MQSEQMSMYQLTRWRFTRTSQCTFIVARATYSWNRNGLSTESNWMASNSYRVITTWRKFDFQIFFLSLNWTNRHHRITLYVFRFALTTDGAIYELCPNTGLLKLNSSEHIEDFIITATNDDGIEILARTKDTDKNFLKVFDFPSKSVCSATENHLWNWQNILLFTDMNCKCSLPISNHVWLIDQPKSSANIFYFGGIKTSSKFVEIVNLHMVSESQPEKRLFTLLAKGMLIEAEV